MRPNFKETQRSRPSFKEAHPIQVTQSPDPEWTYGSGVKHERLNGDHEYVTIDPHAEGRSMMDNYRLLVSGVVPRPIGLISTLSQDGKTENLAPFSYFQLVDHDPPTFVVGFSSRLSRPKDTYRNLLETGECVINIVSEEMAEAVIATSTDPPYGVSEWDVSGLHKAPTETVKPLRVKESIFSLECKLVDRKEFTSHAKPGFSVASIALVEATRFHVRKDALDKDQIRIDLNVLRPIAQLGGISFGRITEVFEYPRNTWRGAVKDAPWLESLEEKNNA